MVSTLITRPDRRLINSLGTVVTGRALKLLKTCVALHQVREHFSNYCRRIRSKSLKATEKWFLLRVLAQVNLALRCNHWYPNI